jgi:3-methylcrotonyl-CoA carboxylase alpha subunit
MPGNVVKVMVAAGDTVEKGAPLVIIESMKMEHTVEAPEAGKVLEVRATAADLTAPMIVMEIAPAGEGAK